MKIKSTRATTDFTQTNINSLLLSTKKEKQPLLLTMTSIDQVNSDSKHTTTDIDENEKSHVIRMKTLGHDLDDQQSIENMQRYQNFVQQQLNLIQKFDGHGDPELWLKSSIEKFDILQVSSTARIELISDLLTGEALIWYAKQQEHMPTFLTFMKKFIQNYVYQALNTELPTTVTAPSGLLKQAELTDSKESVMDCLKNQMLITNLDKLQKFSGKTKQNVSKWLQEIHRTMQMFKLTDNEKLFYISLCLESDARDWFQDNPHLCSTWSTFVQNLLKTFESSGKADVSFNQLRHYQQSINQDVRQYYFEVMKLCKEANPLMDDASKLQYLKDGLKPSLRFDVTSVAKVFRQNVRSFSDHLKAISGSQK
ncbi:unnamed protein product, partial [Rotaria sordida]